MKAFVLTLLIASSTFAATALEDTRESIRLLGEERVEQAKEKIEFVKARLEKQDASRARYTSTVDTFTAHPMHTCHVAISEAVLACRANKKPNVLNVQTRANERNCVAAVDCTIGLND